MLKSETCKDLILVVGENDVNRTLIWKILTARGYQANSLKEAYNTLRELEKTDYKLLIIDTLGFMEDPCYLLQKIRDNYPSSSILTLSDRRLVDIYNTRLARLTDKILFSPLEPKGLLDAVSEIFQTCNPTGGKVNIPDDSQNKLNRSLDNHYTPFNPPLNGGIKEADLQLKGDERVYKSLNQRDASGDVHHYAGKIIPIGGGKGGVGKSVLTANLGAGLASEGKQVIVVDVDISGPNLHTCLGIKKLQRGLFDFLLRKDVPLDELVYPTKIPGLRIIGIQDDHPEGVNIKYKGKKRLLDGLMQLEADYILLDLGSGTTPNVIDFFSLTGGGIIISSPEITSVLNTYGFVKGVFYRKIERYFRFKGKEKLWERVRKASKPENDTKIKKISELESELIKIDPDAEEMMAHVKRNFKTRLVLNMVKNSAEEKIGYSIKNIVKKYLGLDIEYLGPIRRDDAVEASIRSMSLFLLNYPSSRASFCLKSILSKITSDKKPSGNGRGEFKAPLMFLETENVGLNFGKMKMF